jgi:(p)ppGpp synthase/HD superfamily hydrolase
MNDTDLLRIKASLTKCDSDQLSLCESIARIAHAGQFRWDEVTPYITHPARVVAACKYVDEKCVAWLHDVLEDTDVELADLAAAGVPPDVMDAVQALTKVKGEAYEDYLKRVKANGLATRVKIQDILDNLGDTPSSKQVKKYAGALKFLLA